MQHICPRGKDDPFAIIASLIKAEATNNNNYMCAHNKFPLCSSAKIICVGACYFFFNHDEMCVRRKVKIGKRENEEKWRQCVYEVVFN
jgi:hypothetical protein